MGNFLKCLSDNCLKQGLEMTLSTHSTNLPISKGSTLNKSILTLHSVHKLIPMEILRLVFTIFECVPYSFQLFHCSPNTTEQQLELFFNGLVLWENFRYLIIGVDELSNELQEVAIRVYCF